ncbi:hypothetical protein Q8791_06330 [Nocardiopsis sp. CT-R113]|uniref:Uncharacterized protein n=1 Tax=Nocardiopsis codii TaxID=3065942 RepID=A0ABU7K5N5_9ACTN|nr:hypothetical protein [Nocardiopsis sp. CT-R113]MEE2036837.1 hypothetical protein [Nocardiopsis sp. CT-R113]
MFATIAAVLFGLALLLELLGENIQDLVTPRTLTLGGLLFLALHVAGYGTGWGRRRR